MNNGARATGNPERARLLGDHARFASSYPRAFPVINVNTIRCVERVNEDNANKVNANIQLGCFFCITLPEKKLIHV